MYKFNLFKDSFIYKNKKGESLFEFIGFISAVALAGILTFPQIDWDKRETEYNQWKIDITNMISKDKYCREEKGELNIWEGTYMNYNYLTCGNNLFKYQIHRDIYQKSEKGSGRKEAPVESYIFARGRGDFNFIKEIESSSSTIEILNKYFKGGIIQSNSFVNQLIEYDRICKELNHTNGYCIDMYKGGSIDIGKYIIEGKETLGEYK